MANRTILISGASIAGPALAYWLRRYGWSPTIVEQAPAPRSGGQAIDVRGTARGVVERMGIMQEVRSAHTGTQGMYIVNSMGKPLVSMGAEAMNGSGGLIAEIEILRGDLVRILYEATCHDVEYLFDDCITRMTEDDHGVQITFARNAPRAFDLVVGADGLHSSVRRQVFGDESDFVRDLGCYVAVFSTANQYQLSDTELWYSIPGKRDMSGKSVLLYPVRHNQEVRAMFYFAAPKIDVGRHDIAEQKHLVAKAFANETWEVPGLLDAMWEAPEFYCDQVALVQMEHWSRGRVALLGDAAHCPSPMSGMGTSLALIGAYVLAGELAAAAVDGYPAAFASYQRQMREAVRRAQKFARDGQRALLPKSEYQMWMVHQVMRLMMHWPFKGLATSGAEKAANAVTLKEYRNASNATPLNVG
jgi:2-polyprenyl-6-methoxyphenol hydroxylase-like FAD-dependent oxidoreductase